MADGNSSLTLSEFQKLPKEERSKRYGELSDHDKFAVRVTDPGIPSKPQYIPCNHCIYRDKGKPACLAFPQGQTATQIKAVMVDPTIECGNGYHFVAEESKE